MVRPRVSREGVQQLAEALEVQQLSHARGGGRGRRPCGRAARRRAFATGDGRGACKTAHVAVKSDNFRNTYTTFTIRPWALRNSYILSTYGTLYRTLNQVASFTFHPHPPAMLTVASCGAGTIEPTVPNSCLWTA